MLVDLFIDFSILDTLWPGGFIFQCRVFLPFHTVHDRNCGFSCGTLALGVRALGPSTSDTNRNLAFPRGEGTASPCKGWLCFFSFSPYPLVWRRRVDDLLVPHCHFSNDFSLSFIPILLCSFSHWLLYIEMIFVPWLVSFCPLLLLS